MKKGATLKTLFIALLSFVINFIPGVVTILHAQNVLTLQPDGAAGKDAVISSIAGETSVNYGNDFDFMCQSYPYKRGLIQFDLSSIPSNATVISAYLSLYAYNLPGVGGHQVAAYSHTYLYALYQAWDEATVTWDNQPGYSYANYTEFPVADSVDQDFLDIDVRNLVQSSVSFPASNFGYLLSQGNGGRLVFGSSENPDPLLRPKLVVTWAICSGPPPPASITPVNPAPVCYGNTVTLTANSGTGYTYQWYRSGSFISGGSSPVFEAPSSGTYTVKVTNPQGCTALSSGVPVSILLENAYISGNGGSTYYACLNGGLTLNATTATGNTYQWIKDSVNIPGANSSSYFTTQPGTYSCYMTNGGCTLTTNSIIALMQTATVVTTGPTIYCDPANTYLSVTLNTGTGSEQYQWQLNGVDIPGANSYLYWNPSTTGSYSCIVNSPVYCNTPSTSNSVYLQSGVPPQVTLTSSLGASPVNICNGQSIDIALIDVTTGYIWPDTGVTWLLNGQLLISPPYINTGVINNIIESGTYEAYLTTACGISNATPWMMVHSAVAGTTPPPVTPGIANYNVCDSAYFYTDQYDLWAGYQWKKNGVAVPGANSFDFWANEPGGYTCVFYNGCDSITSTSSNVTILNDSAIISAPNSAICSGSSLLLSANTNAGISTYQWKLNGNPITGATASTYPATVAGNYTCEETGPCGTFLSNVLSLAVVQAPIAELTCPLPVYQCAPGSLDLFCNTGSGNSFVWYKDSVLVNGATMSSLNVTSNGTYYATVTAQNGCTKSSEAMEVLLSAPSVNITSANPTTMCSGSYIQLAAQITGQADAIQWKANGVPVAGATGINYAFNINQTTTYTVDVTNACGTYTSPGHTITVNPVPSNTLTALGPVAFCAPGSVTLDNGGGSGLSYKWYLNNLGGLIANANGPTYDATSSGNYFSVVTNIATACSTTTNSIRVSDGGLLATINSSPVPASACVLYQFNANGGSGYSYQWRKNTVAISGAVAQSYTATTTGLYDVIISGACGSNTSNASYIRIDPATINQAGTIIYPDATLICSDQVVQFGINRFVLPPYVYNDLIQWSNNGVPVSPGGNATLFYTNQSGSYTVSLTNACGVVTSAPVAITANPVPVASITAAGPTSFCGAGSVLLNAATGTGYTYQWLLNGLSIPGATGTSYSASVSGTYRCEVASSNGCSALSNFINVYANTIVPAISPGGTVTICSGTNVTFHANANPGYTYQWSLDGIPIPGATDSSYTGTFAGNYTVEITSTCGVFTSSATILDVSPIPQAAISANGPTGFCNGGNVVLTAVYDPDYSYQWKKYGNLIAGATGQSYTATKSGKYRVIVTNGNGCSRVSNAIVVSVYGYPTASITANGPTTFCVGDSVLLTANSGSGYTYMWKRYSGFIPGATGQSFNAKLFGKYRCVVTNMYGCSKASNYIIVDTPCRETDETPQTSGNGSVVTVFPNPSSGSFVIHNPGHNDQSRYYLTDMTGRKTELDATATDNTDIEVNDLASGIYFVEVMNKDDLQTFKVVVTR
ncbi:MAG TPA: DNRLRE domain-containing protein [Bacteroidia bacterium]|nr:DNRLRE domain-containing protein [Bacteroidia bacterium]